MFYVHIRISVIEIVLAIMGAVNDKNLFSKKMYLKNTRFSLCLGFRAVPYMLLNCNS